MDKKLPSVYANKIEKKIENNSKVSVTKNEEKNTKNLEKVQKDTRNIEQKINSIFSSTRYVYKADVIIKLKDKTITKRIVGKNNNHLITIDNELIPINDIIDIKYTD